MDRPDNSGQNFDFSGLSYPYFPGDYLPGSGSVFPSIVMPPGMQGAQQYMEGPPVPPGVFPPAPAAAQVRQYASPETLDLSGMPAAGPPTARGQEGPVPYRDAITEYAKDLRSVLPSTYDPARSFAQNALDPRGIESATNIAMSFGGGGLGTRAPRGAIPEGVQAPGVAAKAPTPPGALPAEGAPQAAAEAPVPVGIRAYHGSPYDFSAFDASKIGTGEGAQAYGHGLYFAENEGVARGYRDALAPPPTFGDQIGNAASLVKLAGSEQGALDALQAALARNPQLQVEIDAIKSGAYKDWKPPGHMYEVNINAEPHQFLDWDKPLSEQPDILQKVIAARRTLGQDSLPDAVLSGKRTGQSEYGMAASREGVGKTGFSQALQEQGIPGIRYLDQGSRVVPGQISINRKIMNDPNVSQAMRDQAKADLAKWESENTTSNYVVFDPKLIEILRKYGLAGLIAGGGALGLGGAAQARPLPGETGR